MTGTRRDAFLAALLLIFAAALRYLASRDDLWFDEIWSFVNLQRYRVTQWWDVLITLRHDNNHMLNTWWIWLLGPDVNELWYRLPPIVCGSLAVLLALAAVKSDGAIAQLSMAIFSVPSYLLIHYSSEARGYGYEMFFVYAAYLLLERLLRRDWPAFRSGQSLSRRDLFEKILFGVCCVLGTLAHPTFLFVFASLGAWAVFVTIGSTKAPTLALRWLFGVFLAPTVLLFLLWVVNLSSLEIGGGPEEIPWFVAVSTLSLMVGGPEHGDASLLIGALVAAAVIVQLVHMAKSHDDRWVCFLAAILMPALALAVTGKLEVYPRYLLGAVLMLLIILSLFAARIAGWGQAWRRAVFGVLVATLIGNGVQVTRLIRDGRGHAKSVVEYLRDHSGDRPILIGTDHDFRHGFLLSFYGRRLGLTDRLVQFPAGGWPPAGPRWILRHELDRTWRWEPALVDPQQRRYELRRVFPYAGLSGWQTAIYERAASEE